MGSLVSNATNINSIQKLCSSYSVEITKLQLSERKHLRQKICPQDNKFIFGSQSCATKHFSQCTHNGIFHCGGSESKCRDDSVEGADLDLRTLGPC